MKPVRVALATANLFMSAACMASPNASSFTTKEDGELALAACHGDDQMVISLIATGANPNALSKKEGSVLISAIKCQNEAGVSALLRRGANPNLPPVSGDWSPLMVAAVFDNPRIIAALVNAGANKDYVSDDADAATPLEAALIRGIESGNWTSYEALLALGADINLSYHDDRNLAEQAAILGQMDKVLDLLERGYRNNLSSLATTVAARHGSPKMEADKVRVLNRLRQLGYSKS